MLTPWSAIRSTTATPFWLVKDLRRLQTIQNTLCRVVCRLPWRGHVSKAMKSPHWLPIQSRIKFKALAIIYKTLHSGKTSISETYHAASIPVEAIQTSRSYVLATMNGEFIAPSNSCQTVSFILPIDCGMIYPWKSEWPRTYRVFARI